MFGFQKSVHSFGAQLASPAALFDAAKRRLAGRGESVVEPDHSGLKRLSKAKHAPEIASEGISAQAVGRLVGLLDSVGFVFERTDWSKRGEGFFMLAERPGRDVGQHRWLKKITGTIKALAAAQQARAAP